MAKPFPPRLEAKRISRPSGDHAGSASKPPLFVRFTAVCPAASITKTLTLVLLNARANAIFLLSGDHAGALSGGRLAARCCTCVPSARMVQRPPPDTSKARRRPSEDHAGPLLPTIGR